MVILRARILQSGLIFNRYYGVFHGVKVFCVYCTSKGSSNEGRIYEGLKKNLLRAHNQGGYLLVKRYSCGSNLPHLALCKINIYIFGSENKVWLDASSSS